MDKIILKKPKREVITIYDESNTAHQITTWDTEEYEYKSIDESKAHQLTNFNQYDTYYVVAKEHEHLESIYEDLETEGKSPKNLNIFRSVECVDRRGKSRSTIYKLTQEEANLLKNDERIIDVGWHTDAVQKKLNIIQTANFDKSFNTEIYFDGNHTPDGFGSGTGQPNDKLYMANWGLLRGTLESQNVYPEWGTEGSHIPGTGGGTVNTNPNIITTIELTQTGKNVDLVVIDSPAVYNTHPEYYGTVNKNTVQSSGNTAPTGSSRLSYYNWWQHTESLGLGSNSTYPGLNNYRYWGAYTIDGHGSHCMGTAAGLTHGWAKDANLYHIYMNANAALRYVGEFHKNKAVNSITGRKNPTITTNSYGASLNQTQWGYPWVTKVNYRGQLHEGPVYDGTLYDKTFAYGPNQYFLISGNYWRSFRDDPFEMANDQHGHQMQFVEYCVSDFRCAKGEMIHPFGSTGLNFDEMYQESIFQDYTTDNWPLGNLISYFTTTEQLAQLTVSTTPTYGTNDNGYWELNLPFDVRFGAGDINDTPQNDYNRFMFNKVYVNTNQTITFGIPSLETEFVYGNNLCANGVPLMSGDYVNDFQPSTESTIKAGIAWCAGKRKPGTAAPGENLNHSIQRIYYGVTGTAPNRKFIIRVEGDYYHTAPVGQSGKIGEYQIFERDWITDQSLSQISVRIIWGENNSKFRTAPLITKIIESNTGLVTPTSHNGIPIPILGETADLEDLMKDGVIFVSAAGNGGYQISQRGDVDFDNWFMNEHHFQYGNIDPTSGDGAVEGYYDKWYYHRGQFPSVKDSKESGGNYDIDPIVVGAIDNSATTYPGSGPFNTEQTPITWDYFYTYGHQTGNETWPDWKILRNAEDAQEYKAYYSSYGTGVDIWAPGTAILSPYSNGVPDPRSNSDNLWILGKISGTSMACPQVAGVLTCALETYPYWSQKEAKEYILSYSMKNKINDTGGFFGWAWQDSFQLGTWIKQIDLSETYGDADPTYMDFYAGWSQGGKKWLYYHTYFGTIGDTYKVNNNYFYYYKERKTTGTVFPKVNVKVRPTEGAVYPRPRIRRSA